MPTKSKFDTALELFVSSQATTMEAARACAEMAIVEYAKSGNLSNMQRLHDAIDEKYGRRQALLFWLVAHAPVTMEKGVLKKNKDEAVLASFEENGTGAEVKCFIEEALAKSFWDYAPTEKPIVNFSADDLDKALKSLIRKFENDKHVAKDEAASARLRVVKERLSIAA